MCACAHACQLQLFDCWLDKDGGGCGGSQQWRSKNVAGTGQAVLHPCESAGSEGISLFLLIFCKLIVSLVVDILQWTKKSENRCASLLVFVYKCNDRVLIPVLINCGQPCKGTEKMFLRCLQEMFSCTVLSLCLCFNAAMFYSLYIFCPFLYLQREKFGIFILPFIKFSTNSTNASV